MNALSSKITSILSSSFADIDIRDALETLDARGVRNNQDMRRNLRLDVQKEIIECNGDIIRDFGLVARQLESVGNALANLQNTCAEMRQHVSTARLATAPMLDEANTLTMQKQQVEAKQTILNAFNAHFLLSDQELLSLTSTAEPVNDDFFLNLVKAKRIHRDSQVLLGTENQRLGLEIVDQSTKDLNAAFQKLYRWIQREFKSLDLENPQMNSAIRRALRVLAERPTLFQSCLDTFAEAREHGLSEAFYSALTGASTSSAPRDHEMMLQKPIEFSAHEPLRYVGDMLAWVHSAAVSEREALEGLFVSEGDELARGIQAGLDSEPWARREQPTDVFDGRKALEQLVDRSLEGVAQLLRQRIDQVVHGHAEPVLAYKTANLVAFYRKIFARLVDHSAGFTVTLDQIHTAALGQFATAMHAHVGSVRAEQPTAPPDLTAPEFLADALEELAALLKSYETSAAAASASDSALHLVLAEALDPFLALCAELADPLSAPADSVFSINCMLPAKATLQTFPFLADRLATLMEALTECAARLVAHLHRSLLQRSGLSPLLAALAPLSLDVDEDIASVPGLPAFAPEALMAARQTLDEFLPSALMDATEEVGRLSSRVLARECAGEAAERFCDDFQGLEGWVGRVDEVCEVGEGGDGEAVGGLRALFPRTGEEIRILLS